MPWSPELWILYVHNQKDRQDPTETERQLDKALRAAGRAWESYNLWHYYCLLVQKTGDYDKVLHLYDSVLRLPLQDPDRHLANLSDFLDETASPELKKNVVARAKEIVSEFAPERARRAKFEEHLEEDMLDKVPRYEIVAWKSYLKYMMALSPDSQQDIKIVMQRCLARCHLEEDMWLMWASWESSLEENQDYLRSVLQNANYKCPSSIEIALKYAEYEEEQGNFECADTILKNIALIKSESSASLERVFLELRGRGQKQRVKELFQTAIDSMPDVLRKSSIAEKFVNYLRIQNEDIEALRILDTAIEVSLKITSYFSSKTRMESIICESRLN